MLEYRDLKNSKKIIFDEMHQLIDEIANFSRLLAENPNNFEIQRQLLIANVDYILAEEKGMFKIIYKWSSANRQVWQPRQDSNLG